MPVRTASGLIKPHGMSRVAFERVGQMIRSEFRTVKSGGTRQKIVYRLVRLRCGYELPDSASDRSLLNISISTAIS